MTKKVGVDDFLAAGHNLEDLKQLAVDDIEEPEAEPLALHNPVYCIHDDQFCLIKTIQGVKVKSPLCNFTARIADEMILDDGLQETRNFVVDGSQKWQQLPPVQVTASQFHHLNWITEKWGSKAIVYAGSATKDHLRTVIQLSTNGLKPRRVFTHTGWREVEGDRVFLTANGALGNDEVEVALKDTLVRYAFPADINEIDAVTAMKASLRFLDFGKFDVMCSLWATMYLSPLCEVLEPAFILWLIGHTGSFKSVLSALALCHFGTFTYLNLPASWRDTANKIEWSMAMLKDLPLVIDDYRPASTSAAQRELESKAEIIIRAQGNKAGRGRLKSDASPREAYIPRGMVISTGEQLPGGESSGARLFVVELEKNDVDLAALAAAQSEQHLYPYTMARYILWLKDNWEYLVPYIRRSCTEYRDKAIAEDVHLRLPNAMASLYIGFELAMAYAVEIQAIDVSDSKAKLEIVWKELTTLASRQAWRVHEERPAVRFLETISTLVSQRRLLLINKNCVEPMPMELKPSQIFVGWLDDNFYYLIPQAIYGVVNDFCQRSGEPLTFNRNAVWADLVRVGAAIRSKDDKNQVTIWIGETDGFNKRVIQLKRSYVEEKLERVYE